jgi:hypothetical protein
MPLDTLMWTDSDFKRRCVGAQLEFVWFPKTCHYSKRRLWLEKAYVATAMVTGPGEPVFEHRWVHRDEFLLQRIKGTL